MIEEEYHFYMGQAQMISYGAMLQILLERYAYSEIGGTFILI